MANNRIPDPLAGRVLFYHYPLQGPPANCAPAAVPGAVLMPKLMDGLNFVFDTPADAEVVWVVPRLRQPLAEAMMLATLVVGARPERRAAECRAVVPARHRQRLGSPTMETPCNSSTHCARALLTCTSA